MVTLLGEIFLRTGRLPAEVWEQPPPARLLCLVKMRQTLEAEAEQSRSLRAAAGRAASSGGRSVRLPRRR